MRIDYSKRIFGLDLMRFTAIMFVLINHALWNFPEGGGAFFMLLKNLGVLGVEIFFVLSGFLIGRILFRIYTSETFSLQDLRYFIIRRWFRTLPAYFLVLLIIIGITVWIGRELPDTLPLYFGFLQNTHFGMDIFFTESWSLPIEEFAYILGPLLLTLTLFLKLKISRARQFLFVTLAILIFFLGTKWVYNYGVSSFSMEQWNIELKAVVLYRIDAIYYGVLAAIISMVRPQTWKRYASLTAGIGFLLFFILHLALQFLSPEGSLFKFALNVLYLPIISISIAFLLPYLSKLTSSASYIVKPITIISLISYSMYLLHYSVVLQLMRLFVDLEKMSLLTKVLFSTAYIAITIILAFILYRIFEKPMMDLRDRPFFKRKAQS